MSISETPGQRRPEGTFKLFATCVAVRGARNSAIYDLNRLRLIAFPTPYLDLLEELQQLSVEQVLHARAASGDADQASAFIDYLLEAEVASFVKDTDAFPALVKEWDCPSIIENAIIDIDDTIHDFRACIAELDGLGCEFLQIRAYSTAFALDHIRTIVVAATSTSIRSVEFMLCYTQSSNVSWMSSCGRTTS